MIISEMTKGETVKLYVTITEPATETEPEQLFDISGCKIYLTVKKSLNDADNEAIIQIAKTTHENPTDGYSEITILPEMTNNVEAGTYFYDVRIIFADSSVSTVETGRLKIKNTVTRSIS